MNKKIFLSISAIIIFGASNAFSTPIHGSSNEVINPGFSDGWNAWEHSGVAIVTGQSVQCILPSGQPHTLRQIVDETKNSLWNSSYHSKIIDLTADVMVDSDVDLTDQAKVKFRFDYWGENQNNVDNPGNLPSPSGYSDWYTFDFSSYKDSQGKSYQKGTWITVNPFNQNSQLFATFQPRWVSVEISLEQSNTDRVHVDNIILTSQCVPEPSTILLLGSGLLGIIAINKKHKQETY